MESTSAQQLFFQHIKNLIPSNLSMVDEIADLLEISNDSAYRRIRGEKPITLEEIKKLCIAFKISLDQLLHLNTESYIFSGKMADPQNFNFDLYMKDFLKQHQIINSFDKRELLILPKDVPVYHYYNFPELAAFKYFFWMKTILRYPDYSKAQFNISLLEENILRTGELILAEYNKIPSTEIWNVENVNTTLRQIEYYKVMGIFASEEDILQIYESLQKVIDHVELQAEAGCKISLVKGNQTLGASFNMYINDFVLGDNTYIPVLNGNKMVFLIHTYLNYMSTKDPVFSEYTYKHFQNIVNKSTLISVTGERERKSFFNRIRLNIEKRKQALLYS